MILDRIYAWADRRPDHPALIRDDEVITYRDFRQRIETTRAFLMVRNLPDAGVAVVFIDDLAHAWVAVLALRALSLDTVCVDTAERADELRIARVACVVTAGANALPAALRASETLAAAPVIAIPEATLEAQAPIEEGLARPARWGGHILYTSGTTGTHKKVYCSPDVEMLRLLSQTNTRKIDERTVHNGVRFPLWTAIGYRQTLTVLALGGTTVLMQKPMPMRTLLDHGVNRVSLTPDMARRLADVCKETRRRSDTLELGVGGGLSAIKLLDDLYEYVTPNVRITYGSTECSSIARLMYRPGVSSHWLPIEADRTIEIVDEDDTVLPDGDEGRLRIGLLAYDSTEYMDDEEATRRHFRDGYFYPGDLAVKRDGSLRIIGREADVLNVEGRKIAAGPLELQIQSMLGVDTVCLFGGLNRQGDEELVVAIECPSLPPRSALEQVTQFCRPFEQVRFECLSDFPRTTAGTAKVNRLALRKLVWPGE